MRLLRFAWLVFEIPLCYACASVPVAAGLVPPTGSGIIDGVPFIAQQDYNCGPASLAAVLNYHGVAVKPEEISRNIYNERIRGSLSLDMALYARTIKGVTAKWFRGTVDDIVNAVNRKRPLIVMIDLGFASIRYPHYVTITGYSGDGVTVNSPPDKPDIINWDTFFKQWDRADRWTLLVYPEISE